MMIGASMAVRPPRSRGPVLMMIDALRRIGGSLWMVDNAFSGAFVDNAGTTPVTAVGDLIGKVLDKTGTNHATQSAVASKPSVQRVPNRTRGATNLLLWSDFQNGVADAPTRGGLVTASALAGYGGALAFGHDGSATSYGYKLFAAALNAAYTLAFVVKMDDGNAPVFGNINNADASNPFAVVMYGNAYSPTGAGGYTVTALADNTYLVMCYAVATTAVPANFGVVKYPTNNNRTFKVTRYGIFTGTVTAQQIIDNGGIPLTTTTALPNVLEWVNVISFGGSNDFLQTDITTGNEGWVCAGVTFGGAGASNETVFASGAGSATQKGVWLLRNGSSSALRMGVGNGTALAMAYVTSLPLLNVPRVVEGGWDASTVFAGVDGTINSTAKTGDVTAPATALVGAFLGGILPLQGPMHAIAYTPVLPDAADRVTIRNGIAALQGRTL